MELHELHVADLGARAKCHRDSIAGRDFGIRGVAVNVAQTAGRQQHGAGADLVQLSRLIENTHAGDAAVFDQQVGGELEFAKRDGLDRRGFQIQRAADLTAGGIAVSVQHAVAAVRSFAGEGNLRSGAIELRAPLDELFDSRRPFFDQHASRFFVDQTVAGLQRVFQVQRDFVVIAERRSNSALRVLRVGLGDFTLGDTENAACGGELDRSAQPGNSRANNDEIGFGWKRVHC